jgi:hypothetical protein
MDQLSLGVMARSRKESERRLAIHPLHIERIDAGLRRRIYLEHGYGERFGVPDERLAGHVAGFGTHEQLLADCDVILLPKPLPADLSELREGQVLWGWPHCVQNQEITQLGIDRRLTLIAFEAMNHWSGDGSFSLHVFHKNNELAGYCSVLHAMQLTGTTGEYGRPLRAAVISFGATGRGAVTALNAHGVNDVHVLTHRDVTAVASPIHSARMVHFEPAAGDPGRCQVLGENGRAPMAAYLTGFDIVVNCVLQHPGTPLMFLTEDDLAAFAPRSPSRCSPWAATSATTPWTTAHHCYGTPPPGKSAKPCCHTCSRYSPGQRRGMPTRPSSAPWKSAAASSRTRPSCPSSTAHRTTRTPGSSNKKEMERATRGKCVNVRFRDGWRWSIWSA